MDINLIHHGNNIEILSSMKDMTIDVIFADPPYNLQLENELTRPNENKYDGVDNNWDKFATPKDYDNYSEQWLSQCHRIMKDDATIWVIGTYHNIFRLGKIMQDLGFWILNDFF